MAQTDAALYTFHHPGAKDLVVKYGPGGAEGAGKLFKTFTWYRPKYEGALQCNL